ncbi:MAG: MFS transporter [Candidatus Liptonbacteria bacterium]|nr:MFS transporter [Candidatus Liptonbacteria bacterium]
MSKTNRLLLATSYIGFLTVGLFGPIYAIFVKKIGGDILEAGASYGLFAIVSGIMILTLGRTTFFQKNLRLLVVIGFGLFTVGDLAYLFIQNPPQLFILQIFLGISEGFLEPAWDGLFSANLTEEQSVRFWAIWAGGKDIAMGAGALAGGALVAAYSFTALFILLALLNAAGTIIVSRILWVKDK